MADRGQRDQWISAEYFQSTFHGDGGTLSDKTLEEMEPVAALLPWQNAAAALN